jgi:DUF4097 and DUF4098 domain-containing protein YvlB
MSSIRSKCALAATGLAVVLAAAAGCNAISFLPMVSASKTLSEDFKTSDAPKIVVDTFNGSIDVSRGNDGEVQVDVTKQASGIDEATAQAALDNVQVTMVQKDDAIVITAKRLDRHPGNFGASVVIAVPAKAQLNVETSNGPIVCEGIEGPISAESSNGKLEIVDGHGKIHLDTSNGPIEVEATDAVVNAETSNGRIEFRGSLAEGSSTFETSNSRIELVLPDDSEFKFQADTSNGRITSDFNLDIDGGRQRRTHVKGTVGDNPKCSIVAETSNGSIALRRPGQHKD